MSDSTTLTSCFLPRKLSTSLYTSSSGSSASRWEASRAASPVESAAVEVDATGCGVSAPCAASGSGVFSFSAIVSGPAVSPASVREEDEVNLDETRPD